MKSVKLIRQQDEKDCGAACLSMVLQYHGKQIPLSKVREAVKVDQYGANIYGLLDGGRAFELKGEAFQGTPEDTWDAILAGEVGFPAIIRIVNKYQFEHYCVLEGVRKGQLLIVDPGEGKKKIGRDEFMKCFLGQIILFEKCPEFAAEKQRRSTMSRFLEIAFHQKKLLVTVWLLSLGVTVVGLGGTFLFQYMIDDVVGGSDRGYFTGILILMGFLYGLSFVVEILRARLIAYMTREMNLPLMLGYYDHVTRLPMNFFDTRKTGEIMSRFGDASRICEAVSSAAISMVLDLIMVVGCGFILYVQSPGLTLIAVGTFALYLFISIAYVKPLDKINRELMEDNAMFNSHLKESIDGMETVRISGGEHVISEKAHVMFETYVDRTIRGGMMSVTKESLIQMVTSMGTLLLLWFGSAQVMAGTMSIGALITFSSMMAYFLNPIQNLVGMQDTMESAVAAADRLYDVMDMTEEEGGNLEIEHIDSISMHKVDFRYGNREKVLEQMSFRAEKGEQIALVGESGCGKSTVTRLLMGLYRPETGIVRVNDRDLKEISLDSLRRKTAYVPQNTMLFSDTIHNNLVFGLEEGQMPDYDELEWILDLCRCEFVKDMPFGIDSVLEENGCNLSGGQRQRLAIARALLRKPELLILDEATSALDTMTERTILDNLQAFFPQMIVVSVAHRLSTIRNCTRIYVCDKGQIVECGCHEDLMEENQRYAELWKRQAA